MIQYIVTPNNSHYTLSYQELREDYLKYVSMSDLQFIEELHHVIHFACITSWFKELGTEATLSDEGIIHRLVHLLTKSENINHSLPEIRQQFNDLLRLS